MERGRLCLCSIYPESSFEMLHIPVWSSQLSMNLYICRLIESDECGDFTGPLRSQNSHRVLVSRCLSQWLGSEISTALTQPGLRKICVGLLNPWGVKGEMCCHHPEIKTCEINMEAFFKVEQAMMSCYRAFLLLPWEEDISSLLQHILIGSLLWDPGPVLGTGGMVMNETDMTCPPRACKSYRQ